jgi:quercetin dioxygenase-like cupin family protein
MIAFDLDGLAGSDDTGAGMRVLADTGAARLVLVSLRAGQELPEQWAPSQLVVQALRGHASLCSGPVARPLAPGTLLLVEERVPHRLRALEDATILFIYTPSPAVAGEDTTLFATLPAYVRRQGPSMVRSRTHDLGRTPRRPLPVLRTRPQ